jgi:hypothetical protein
MKDPFGELNNIVNKALSSMYSVIDLPPDQGNALELAMLRFQWTTRRRKTWQ